MQVLQPPGLLELGQLAEQRHDVDGQRDLLAAAGTRQRRHQQLVPAGQRNHQRLRNENLKSMEAQKPHLTMNTNQGQGLKSIEEDCQVRQV